MRPLRLPLLALLYLAPFHVGAQPKQTPPASASTPAVVAEFVQLAGPNPSAEEFYSKAKEALWRVYPHDAALKTELVAFIQSGPEGPGLGFAAIALIPFHDPATVKPILDRAVDPKISPATRFALLNSAPYVLAMGDVWTDGEGQLDSEAREYAKELKEAAAEAAQQGLGRFHARSLRELYDISQREKIEDEDFGLAYWHTSAYLVGTLDLRDFPVLEPLLNPKEGNVFANLMFALSFASNRNLLQRLQSLEQGQVTPQEEQAAAAAARNWWREYLQAHPDGDWLPAALTGFRAAGYSVEDDLKSSASSRELLRALESKDEITRFAAARLLNRAYGTQFNLDTIFHSGKYAFSFLDPMADAERNQERLRDYWRKRLAP